MIRSTDLLTDTQLNRVLRCMVATDWKWQHPGGAMSTPTLAKMRETIDGLLKHLKPGEVVRTGTGGFFAELANDDKPADEGVRIWFELVSGEYPE